MWRYVLLAVSLLSFASYGPAMFTQKLAETRSADSPAAAAKAETGEDLSGRKVRIKADAKGHFVTQARLNNRSVDVLVDTGATRIAINRSTAKRIGIELAEKDFVRKVQTANGDTMAALAVIDTIQIGSVKVNNVDAMVLKDQDLSGTLLGMSFLGRLKRFEFEKGSLLLSQ
jgi:aspartyl protease family protein